MDTCFDIALLSETWFNSTHNISLPEYSIIRKAVENRGVGNNDLKTIPFCCIDFNVIINLGIKIKGIQKHIGRSELFSVSAYKPPNVNLTSEDFEQVFRLLKTV